MEALIYILGMLVVMESAAIVVLWNESSGKSRENTLLRRRIDSAMKTLAENGKIISEMKEYIRELRKDKTNKN
jgi:hypothetical protein